MFEMTPYESPWMDGELGSLRDMAREFFKRESVPNQERWAEQHQVDRDFWRKAGDSGLLCMSIPEEYGGGGGTFAHEAVVLEEQASAGDDAFDFGFSLGLLLDGIEKLVQRSGHQRGGTDVVDDQVGDQPTP